MTAKVHMGDDVWAELESGILTLTTSNGILITNTIHLKPEVIQTLLDYLEYWRGKKWQKSA